MPACEHGIDPAQLALAYVASRPFVTSNIIGTTRLEQLDSNLASLDLKLTDELLAGIKRIHTEQPNPTPGVIALGSVDRDCLGKPIAEPLRTGFERQERPYA